jgi:hypothetical protein
MDEPHPMSVDPAADLNAQATAFARLQGRSPDDLDHAWRQAAALADGLFPHQVEGIAFLLGCRRAILADDMGLADTPRRIEDDDLVDRLLREASETLRITAESNARAVAPVRRPEEIDALSNVLSGPSVAHYRIASALQPGIESVITAGDADVECSAPVLSIAGSAVMRGM